MGHDDSHDIENSKCKMNETITNMKEIQPVELEKVSEVESITISESNIDPFETMYGEMDEESFHRMMEGNDWTYSPLFSDKEFQNEDWHKYTCTETCASIGNARHGCKSLGTDIQSIREIDDSGCPLISEIDTVMTNMTGSSILKSTGHTGRVKPVNLSVRFILGDGEQDGDDHSDSESEIIEDDSEDDWELGILRKGMSSYSSPIMLIPRKLTGIPRIVTDFRHLNNRLVTLQPSIPLVRDAIQILGSSGSEVLSLADLRDAYHTLRLAKRSQKFCGITPYYGSDSYLYQRLGMGLSVSPAIWQNFIQRVLQEIPDYRKNYLAIMDDILTHSNREDHTGYLIDLFKAIIRNGLKISPRKCRLFKTELVFMGVIIKIEDGMPKMQPLKSRIEAIQKVRPPKTVKDCRSFCGMVNYMSVFLPSLQEKLIPKFARKIDPYILYN